MVIKKNEESKDLTRIEDLSEFLHQEDSELDSRFQNLESNENNKKASLDELNDLVDESLTESALDDDLPPDLPQEISNQVPLEESSSLFESEHFHFEENTEFQDENIDDFVINDTTLNNEESFSINNVDEEEFHFASENEQNFDSAIEEVQSPTFSEELTNTYEELEDLSHSLRQEINDSTNDSFIEESESLPHLPPERFEDVKTFAQNFSYGKSTGVGGNPPFSLIARNIKYKDDSESILIILEEFGIVNSQNEKDYKMALELGSLIVPQISEYMAIVLAHKLRRFDLDLEVGLSDEVHPSKTGEHNPRGLIKKENIKQNKSQSLKFSKLNFKLSDIIVTTNSQISGYKIEQYLNVVSKFAIVEEEELEKLQFIQQTIRENSTIHELDLKESDSMSSLKAFNDYQKSFTLIYDDLISQLKQKALAESANALIGLQFQISPLQFDRKEKRKNAYQITCFATLAIVSKDEE
jgi:uncharacterized protein YbjQ (UPF0145 family)